MPISVLWHGAGLFAFCLALHVVFCRLRWPKHPIIFLLILFLALPVLCAGALLLIKGLDLRHAAAVLLLHGALSCAYIQSFPVILDSSPSLIILPMLEREPMSAEELLSRLDAGALLDERIHYLVKAGLARQSGDRLHLTWRSSLLLSGFRLIRKTLGLPLMGRG